MDHCTGYAGTAPLRHGPVSGNSDRICHRGNLRSPTRSATLLVSLTREYTDVSPDGWRGLKTRTGHRQFCAGAGQCSSVSTGSGES